MRTHIRSLLLGLTSAICWSSIVSAQFTTVINVPPDVAPQGIGSNTQLNFGDGGEMFGGFDVGSPDGTSTNVELNITGGLANSLYRAHNGSTVNISGGSVQSFFDANSGSVVNITGGFVGSSFDANSGSIVNISGGRIGADFDANSGSTMHLSGGVITDTFEAKSGSNLHIYGGELRLNGALIGGLTSVGDSVSLDLVTFYAVTGTLSDGTSFALANSDRDFIGNASVTLHAVALPAVGPALITALIDPVPTGIRAGQTLVVDSGGSVSSDFNAGLGSSVQILPGATVGANFETAGAVTISGGTVGDFFDAFYGSTVNISGGVIGKELGIHGGTVNVSGGSIGQMLGVANAGTLNLSGGSIGAQSKVGFEGIANISGGEVGEQFTASVGSVVNITGGVIHNDLSAVGATLDLHGGDLRIDGVPIAGLENVGDSLQVNLASAAVLTGTLADGTPFVFSQSGGEETFLNADSFNFGGLTLHTTVVPIAAPFVKLASVDGVPATLREGQALIVDDGGVVGENFIAARGSSLEIQAGASVGEELEVAWSDVTITGGAVGQLFNAIGSTVDISGGTIGDFFRAKTGSTVNVTGGTLGKNVAVQSDSTFNLAAGSIGDSFSAGHFSGLSNNVEVNISGGTVGDRSSAYHGSTVNITGGSIGEDFAAHSGSTINFSGGTVGPRFEANNGSEVNIFGDAFSYTLYANAGSLVTISGGVTGSVYADGGAVNVSGGVLQGILYGNDSSVVQVSGGTIVHGIIANSGSNVEVTGGNIDYVRANSGSVVSISGGRDFSGLATFLQSELHLYGGDFHFGGVPISGLENVGDSVPFGTLTSALSGTLADGTPFAFSENSFEFFTNGTVFLHAASLPAVGPALINAATDPVPFGIRQGQTLVVDAGGVVGEHFAAGWGSTVHVGEGGSIDYGFEATGSEVNIDGGTVVWMKAFHSSVVNISGGSVGSGFIADEGSTVNISGGSMGDGVTAHSGSNVNILGGSVGSGFNANSASVVNVYGGAVGDDFDADSGSIINLFGSAFLLDGQPIDGLMLNEPFLLSDRDVTLTGVLFDGTSFSFDLNSTNSNQQDFFHPNAALTLTQQLPGDFDRDADVDGDDYDFWKQHFGQSVAIYSDADGNGDGVVSAADYTVWRDHLAAAGEAASSMVPEPAGLFVAMVLVSILACACHRTCR